MGVWKRIWIGILVLKILDHLDIVIRVRIDKCALSIIVEVRVSEIFIC